MGPHAQKGGLGFSPRGRGTTTHTNTSTNECMTRVADQLTARSWTEKSFKSLIAYNAHQPIQNATQTLPFQACHCYLGPTDATASPSLLIQIQQCHLRHTTTIPDQYQVFQAYHCYSRAAQLSQVCRRFSKPVPVVPGLLRIPTTSSIPSRQKLYSGSLQTHSFPLLAITVCQHAYTFLKSEDSATHWKALQRIQRNQGIPEMKTNTSKQLNSEFFSSRKLLPHFLSVFCKCANEDHIMNRSCSAYLFFSTDGPSWTKLLGMTPNLGEAILISSWKVISLPRVFLKAKNPARISEVWAELQAWNREASIFYIYIREKMSAKAHKMYHQASIQFLLPCCFQISAKL